MRRSMRSLAGSTAALVLAFGVAVPAAAEDLGYIRIDVEVYGYTAGYPGGGMSFELACSGGVPADPIGVTLDGTSGQSEPGGPFPVGTTCSIVGADTGWAGDQAEFQQPEISPGAVVIGLDTSVFTVRVMRVHDGSPPQWDQVAEFRLDVLTADRAQVNRYGGLTISGRLSCASIASLPIDQYLNVNWAATQYVGRKTAITAAYDSAIATDCFDETSPSVPVVWQTFGPGTQDSVQWIYASNGKFGTGMVHVEVRVESWQERVSQWWDETGEGYDPACSTTPVDSGFYDQNGDGFCAYSVVLWGAEQFDLRAERAR